MLLAITSKQAGLKETTSCLVNLQATDSHMAYKIERESLKNAGVIFF